MRDKVLVFKCPHCGKQNLVSSERLKLAKKRPVKCWVCQKVIPVELIEKISEVSD